MNLIHSLIIVTLMSFSASCMPSNIPTANSGQQEKRLTKTARIVICSDSSAPHKHPWLPNVNSAIQRLKSVSYDREDFVVENGNIDECRAIKNQVCVGKTGAVYCNGDALASLLDTLAWRASASTRQTPYDSFEYFDTSVALALDALVYTKRKLKIDESKLAVFHEYRRSLYTIVEHLRTDESDLQFGEFVDIESLSRFELAQSIYQIAAGYVLGYVLGHELAHAHGECRLPPSGWLAESTFVKNIPRLQKVLCPKSPLDIDELRADMCGLSVVQYIDDQISSRKELSPIRASKPSIVSNGRRLAVDAISWFLPFSLDSSYSDVVLEDRLVYEDGLPGQMLYVANPVPKGHVFPALRMIAFSESLKQGEKHHKNYVSLCGESGKHLLLSINVARSSCNPPENGSQKIDYTGLEENFRPYVTEGVLSFWKKRRVELRGGITFACVKNPDDSYMNWRDEVFLKTDLPVNENEQFDAWNDQCSQGNSESCFHVGIVKLRGGHSKNRDVGDAASYLKRACENGHGKACIVLAPLFAFGNGVSEDTNKFHETLELGMSILENKCKKDELSACTDLNVMYANSWGKTDYKKSSLIQKFQLLCARGEYEACYAYGILLRGNAIYSVEANEIWAQACDNGNASACAQAGFPFLENRRHPRWKELLETGCKMDHALSCYFFGQATDNIEDVRERLEKGCILGHAAACVDFGNFIEREQPGKAEKAYRIACDWLGGIKSPSDAIEHYSLIPISLTDKQQITETRGYDWGAAYGCGELGRRIRGEKPEEALRLFELACDNGYAKGCTNAARELAKHDNMKEGNTRVIELLDRACRMLDNEACNFLRELRIARGAIAASNSNNVLLDNDWFSAFENSQQAKFKKLTGPPPEKILKWVMQAFNGGDLQNIEEMKKVLISRYRLGKNDFGEHKVETVFLLGVIALIEKDTKNEMKYFIEAAELSPEVSLLSKVVGAAAEELDEFEIARKYFQRALEQDTNDLGAHHPDVANDLEQLAEIYEKMDKIEKAAEYYRRVIKEYGEIEGKDALVVVTSMVNLGNLLAKQKQWEEAEDQLRRAVKTAEKRLGKQSLEVADAIEYLAALLAVTERTDEAASCFCRAFQIYVKFEGKDHPHSLVLQKILTELENSGIKMQCKIKTSIPQLVGPPLP